MSPLKGGKEIQLGGFMEGECKPRLLCVIKSDNFLKQVMYTQIYTSSYQNIPLTCSTCFKQLSGMQMIISLIEFPDDTVFFDHYRVLLYNIYISYFLRGPNNTQLLCSCSRFINHSEGTRRRLHVVFMVRGCRLTNEFLWLQWLSDLHFQPSL